MPRQSQICLRELIQNISENLNLLDTALSNSFLTCVLVLKNDSKVLSRSSAVASNVDLIFVKSVFIEGGATVTLQDFCFSEETLCRDSELQTNMQRVFSHSAICGTKLRWFSVMLIVVENKSFRLAQVLTVFHVDRNRIWSYQKQFTFLRCIGVSTSLDRVNKTPNCVGLR